MENPFAEVLMRHTDHVIINIFHCNLTVPEGDQRRLNFFNRETCRYIVID